MEPRRWGALEFTRAGRKARDIYRCRATGGGVADECRHPAIDPRKPSQATRRNSAGEEGATGESRKIIGASGAQGVGTSVILAWAPAHASTDKLLQLAADKDGWRREVLRIDPSL